MAPLSQALQVSFESKNDDGTSYYCCDLDPSWAVLAVPQGGYSLGVIVEACIQHQASSSHADPIYVSAHFLRSTYTGVGQVQVKLIKSGKIFTNILAELVQQGITRITAHLVFGNLSLPRPGQEQGLLMPPSPYARRVPLHSHPSTVSLNQSKLPWMSKMDTRVSVDAVLSARNDPSSTARTTAESVGGGGVEWGAWFELADKDDKITTSSVPFLCDSFLNLPLLLPSSEPASVGGNKSWFPTIAMTVEFKAKIPSSEDYSTRTVGLYTESRFLNNPESRHNVRVEVWSAPSQIGQGDVSIGWRDHQYCIAVADQMALMVPVELNLRNGSPAKL